MAEVIDATENIRNEGQANGKRSVLVIIYLQPNANVIESVDEVRALLPELQAALPNDIDLQVVSDRTVTIRGSLKEVEQALLISIILVVLVTFAFLRSARAGFVAAVAVPVSLIGTFGGMYLLGFSINNLSLMAMAIAAGFVVDDAIIVLENVSRHIEAGMGRIDAAAPGRARGRLHRRVHEPVADRGLHPDPADGRHRRPPVPRVRRHALDRHPDLDGGVADHHADDVRLRAAPAQRPPAGPLLPLERARLRRPSALATATALRLVLRHPLLDHAGVPGDGASSTSISMSPSPRASSRSRTPAASSAASAPTRASPSRLMRRKFRQFMEIVRRIRRSTAWSASPAAFSTNSGFVFVTLKPLDERKISADQVIARLRPSSPRCRAPTSSWQAVQDIRVGGRQSNAQYQFTLQGDRCPISTSGRRSWRRRCSQDQSVMTDVDSDQQQRGCRPTSPSTATRRRGSASSTRRSTTTLYDAFGQRQVSTIYNALNQYHVVMEVAPEFWQNPER